MRYRLRQLGVSFVLMAVVPAPGHAQDRGEFWDRVGSAMRQGILPDKVRGLVKGCAQEAPTSEQWAMLSDLLATGGIEAPSAQQRWIRGLQCPPAVPAPGIEIAREPRSAPSSGPAGETSLDENQQLELMQEAHALFRKATASKDTADLQRAYSTVERASRVVSGKLRPTADLLMGTTAIQFGQVKLSQSMDNRSCLPAREAKELLIVAEGRLPRANAIAPDAVRTLMGALMQLLPAADQLIKQYCR